ncbi:MAG: hypothetical protein WC831_04005 [Parcubacteria group bacterium]|jgi:hypothetical protein
MDKKIEESLFHPEEGSFMDEVPKNVKHEFVEQGIGQEVKLVRKEWIQVEEDAKKIGKMAKIIGQHEGKEVDASVFAVLMEQAKEEDKKRTADIQKKSEELYSACTQREVSVDKFFSDNPELIRNKNFLETFLKSYPNFVAIFSNRIPEDLRNNEDFLLKMVDASAKTIRYFPSEEMLKNLDFLLKAVEKRPDVLNEIKDIGETNELIKLLNSLVI